MKPKTPQKNRVVYCDGDTIIIKSETEEFRTFENAYAQILFLDEEGRRNG